MLNKVLELMQRHDWYYEYSDDSKDWHRGLLEKKAILAAARGTPKNELQRLLACVPEDMRKEWSVVLERQIGEDLKEST